MHMHCVHSTSLHALQCPQRARTKNTKQKSQRWFCLRFDLCELWPNCTRYLDCDARKKKSRPMWCATNVQYSIASAASDSSFVGHLPQRAHLKIHRNEEEKSTRRASPIWQHCLSRVASHSKSSKRAKKKKSVERKCTSIVSATHTHTRASAFQLRQTNDTRCCIKPHRNELNRHGEWLYPNDAFRSACKIN